MPSLRLYTPVNEGEKFLLDVSDLASGYTHTVRRDGGYWLAHFTLFLDETNITKQVLTDFFSNM